MRQLSDISSDLFELRRLKAEFRVTYAKFARTARDGSIRLNARRLTHVCMTCSGGLERATGIFD